MGAIAYKFRLSPDELFNLTMDRYNFYLAWLGWYNESNIPPEKRPKPFSELDKEFGSNNILGG